MSNRVSFDLTSIPEEWSIIPCGVFFKEKSIKNTEGEMNLSVYRDYGVIPKDSRDDNHNRVSEDTSNYKLVESGDFVLNKMKGWSGSLGVSEYRGIVSPSYTVLEPVREIHNKYFHYLLRSETYRQMYESLSYGVRIGQWELRYHDFKQIPSLYPPIDEQKLISRCLDKKTEQIDSLIEKIQKKIELLKEQRTSLINQCVTKGLDPNVEMKDSGVEWIGEIPSHWSLKKITHVTHMMGSGTTPKSDNKDYYEDGNINWLVTGDLTDDYVFQTSNKVTQKALDELSSLKIYPENSLLIAMYGATIGKLGILKTETTVNQATSVLNFDDSNSVDFWFYVFLSNRNYLVSLGYGGGQPNISQDVIKGLRFPSPPTLDEQSLIVNKIRSTLSNHDRIIEVENTRIKLLKEYRQSLISSVVTGKVRVTEDMT